MIRTHRGPAGATRRTAVSACVLAVVALLCAIGLCTPSAAHGGGEGPRLHTSIEPDMDYEEPGSSCHGGPGMPADPVPPPPVPLHVPAPDPVPRAALDCAAPGPAGPVHDAVPSVDLHRLQIQRT
ncbi:hypothetical protein [Streptomyces johnsoniae]|uniref:Secreted protein n=1 Tax=Streptomyces johnsoniae TaxID=3075532 RepID=A0ABU2SBK1_9ACTN|nr:hypothetical protein [Streptomyces sp. DSM 41886]MDT0445789.1 hypothetical protein [Streptomyces sp. DSM 41886]